MACIQCVGRTDPDQFTATLLSHPSSDSTQGDASVLSYNLSQGILNGLGKFTQRHAAAQFCRVSIKKSLLGGEVACTTVCQMTLSQTRDELCTPDQSACRREYCGSQAATSKLRCRVPLIIYLCNWQLGQDVNVPLETRSSGRCPSGCQT